jgi:hypothetical protein
MAITLSNQPTGTQFELCQLCFFCAGVKRLLHEKLVCLKFLVKSSIDEFVAAVNKDVNTQGLSISAGSIILLLHIHYNVIKSMTGGVTGIGFAYF